MVNAALGMGVIMIIKAPNGRVLKLWEWGELSKQVKAIKLFMKGNKGFNNAKTKAVGNQKKFDTIGVSSS